MRIFMNFALVSLLALVTGCAAMQGRAGASPKASAAASAVSDQDAPPVKAPVLPKVELTGGLLDKLLQAEFNAGSGHYDAAAKIYLHLARRTRDPRLAESATRNATLARDNPLALGAVKTWIELAPESLQAREFAATLYLRAGKEQEVLEQLHKIVKLSPPESGFSSVASLLSRETDNPITMAIVKKFVANYPDSVEAEYAYAYVAFRSGKMDVALNEIDSVLKKKPNWVQAIVFRSRLLLVQGKTEDSIDYLKKNVKRLPSSEELHFSYAQVLLNAKRVEQAYDQFKEVSRLAPDNGDVLFTLGVLAIQLNYIDQAEDYLQRALTINGGSDEQYYFLGQVAELKKDYKKAIEYYSRVDGGDYFFDAKIRTAALIAKQGDVETARSDLSNLRVLMPERRVEIFLAEGDILRQAERYKDAMDVYNRALAEFPDNNDLLYARAFAAAKLDKLALAEHDLHKILDREPNNAEALNALGYTLADQTTRYQEALQYIKRALDLRPDDYFVLDSMGWVQYRLGNYDEALKYLKRAMNMSNDTEIAAHLGEVLWTMGQQDAARDVWDKALKQAPNNKMIQEVMKRLEP